MLGHVPRSISPCSFLEAEGAVWSWQKEPESRLEYKQVMEAVEKHEAADNNVGTVIPRRAVVGVTRASASL